MFCHFNIKSTLKILAISIHLLTFTAYAGGGGLRGTHAPGAQHTPSSQLSRPETPASVHVGSQWYEQTYDKTIDGCFKKLVESHVLIIGRGDRNKTETMSREARSANYIYSSENGFEKLYINQNDLSAGNCTQASAAKGTRCRVFFRTHVSRQGLPIEISGSAGVALTQIKDGFQCSVVTKECTKENGKKKHDYMLLNPICRQSDLIIKNEKNSQLIAQFPIIRFDNEEVGTQAIHYVNDTNVNTSHPTQFVQITQKPSQISVVPNNSTEPQVGGVN